MATAAQQGSGNGSTKASSRASLTILKPATVSDDPASMNAAAVLARGLSQVGGSQNQFYGRSPLNAECAVQGFVAPVPGTSELRVSLLFEDLPPRLASRFLEILKGRG